jgi:rubredoxin
VANFRYILQPYKPNLRYECPDCGKKKSFARYIDTETDEQLNDKVGRCNRESGCGYHYSPKEYFTDNNIPQDENTFKSSKPRVIQPINFIDQKVFTKSLTGYGSNHLVTFLKSLFDDGTAQNLITKYQLGTSGHWPGSTTFWYVDTLDRVNYGKIMVYDPSTGKRDKVKIEHCASVLEKAHTHAGTAAPEWLIKYQENESKINCLFGEHLLKKDPNKPVAIVESEKTALIGSVYLPQYIWLAVGALSYLNAKKCVPLSGRSVTLFPDLGSPGKDGDLCLDKETGDIYQKCNGVWALINESVDVTKDFDKARFQHFGIEKTKSAYVKWKGKGDELCFKTSDLLEQTATPEERQAGLDIADYLIKLNVTEFAADQDDTIDVISHSEKYREALPLGITEVVELHAKYTEAEQRGALINHPDPNIINSLWQGVVLYRNEPARQQHYIQQLNNILL